MNIKPEPPDQETEMLSYLLEAFVLMKFGAPARPFLFLYEVADGKGGIISNAGAEDRMRIASQYVQAESRSGTKVPGVEVLIIPPSGSDNAN